MTEAEPNEARWTGRKIEPFTSWIKTALYATGTPDKTIGAILRMMDEVHVGTPNGVMVCQRGDWLMRNPATGEIYVMTEYERSLNSSFKEALTPA